MKLTEVQENRIAAESSSAAERLLATLMGECVAKDASDLHIAPGLPAHLRVHGVLEQQTAAGILDADMTQAMAEILCRGFDMSTLGTTGSVDGALTAADGTRFRFNVFRRQAQLSIALRRLEDRFRTLGDLGLPETLYDLCSLPDGLVIVAGPTGAGKSTTLATLIDRINQTRRAHIVTIEDPIEYLHKSSQSLVNQRQVGLDAGGFNDALVASLRQDPDVILVGEIRDLNTIRTAITAAETGHLVMGTLHTNNAIRTINRVLDVFPPKQQSQIRAMVSESLRAIVSQRLISSPDGSKRVPALEVLFVKPSVSNLIREEKTFQIRSIMQTGRADGMALLDDSLLELVKANQITKEAARKVAEDPKRFA